MRRAECKDRGERGMKARDEPERTEWVESVTEWLAYRRLFLSVFVSLILLSLDRAEPV